MANRIDQVTIGIICDKKGKEIISAIDSIVRQTYPSIEIIISANRSSGVEMAECLEYIRAYSGDNIKNVIVHYEKIPKTVMEHARRIYEQASGEFLVYFLRESCFWVNDALRTFMNDFWDEFDAVKGVTMCFENGRYLGMNAETVCEVGAYGFRVSAIPAVCFSEAKTMDELTAKLYLEIGENGGVAQSDCVLVKYDGNTELRLVTQKVGDLECAITTDEVYLSYAGGHRLLEIAEEMKKSKSVGLHMAQEEIKDIMDYRSEGMLGLSRSDASMLSLLQEMIEKQNLEEIIFKVNAHRNHKIRVVIVGNEFPIWQSCAQSVWEELQSDERFEGKVVYVPFQQEYKEDKDYRDEWMNYQEAGVPIEKHDAFNLAEYSPDCVLYTKPYSLPYGWDIQETSRIAPRTIYVPYSMLPTYDTRILLDYSSRMPLHALVWKRLSYSKKCTEGIIKYAYNKENYLCIGHPRFDLSIQNLGKTERDLYERLKKAAGTRKVLFLNSHFDLNMEDDDARGTFFKIGKKLLEYCKVHDEYFLIWRPHPFFWGALAQSMENANVKEDYVKMLEPYENIYVDCQKSYFPALFLSDALISDNSSVITGYLVTEKPILLTKKMKKDDDIEERHFYYGYSIEDVISFMEDVVIREKDEKKEVRTEYMKQNYYLDPGKRCSRKLLDAILESYK